MKTKNILNIILVAVLVFTSACTDNFDKINSDPDKIEKMDPAYLFTRVWMRYNGSPHEELRSNLIMAGPLSGILQSAYRDGQGFVGTNDGYNEAKMNEMYKDAVKHGVDMLHILKDDVENDNTAKIAQGTITMQFVYQRITDLYGDIPYHEAGLGFHEGIFYPKYDSQEDIYKSSVDSLKKYRDILLETDAEPFAATADIFFGSQSNDEIRKSWARTANSLIMRLGMRASAADEAWAQATVEEAANHSVGYIESISLKSDAFILQTKAVGGDWGNHINGANSGGALHGWGHGYIGEEWLRTAQQKRDPRIFYTTCQVINENGWKAWTGMPNYDAFAEAARPGEPWKPVTYMPIRAGGTESYSIRGMMSVDGDRLFADWTVELDTSATGSPEYVQYHTVASVNPETIGNQEAPIVVFGGDESHYILAEAAERGWNVPGDRNTHLEKALNLTFDKYPDLFGFGESAGTYLAMQSATEGTTLTYEGLKVDYINDVMLGNIDLETIWTERWKSMMSTFTYDAFALWNRTNLAIVPQGISYPGTEMMELPSYTADQVADPVFGQEITPIEYVSEPFHNGGNTEGFRPRRINYPNAERTNNSEHIEEAMSRQISDYGQVGSGSHFITTNMWISKKN